MSDPRRRRQIKTPTGPRKKDAPDLSKYKMNPPPMGRQEVPKPQPKPDPSQQRSGQRAVAASAKVDAPARPKQGGRNDKVDAKAAEDKDDGRETNHALNPRR